MSKETLTIGGTEDKETPVDSLTVSRRWLLLKVGALFNAIVGLAVAVPVVKYLLSPAKSDDDYQSWVSLGAVDSFPIGETRLAKFTNPVSQVWDGETDRVACWVRRTGSTGFQVFAVNCAHLGCPVRWFPTAYRPECSSSVPHNRGTGARTPYLSSRRHS